MTVITAVVTVVVTAVIVMVITTVVVAIGITSVIITHAVTLSLPQGSDRVSKGHVSTGQLLDSVFQSFHFFLDLFFAPLICDTIGNGNIISMPQRVRLCSGRDVGITNSPGAIRFAVALIAREDFRVPSLSGIKRVVRGEGKVGG